MSNIDVVNQKLDSHIENQNRINESLVKNLDKLTEAVSEVRVYEASLNNLREDVTDIKQVLQITVDRLGNVEHQTELNTELRKDQKHIKQAIIGALIVCAVGFAWASIFPSKSTVDLSQETIEKIKKSD